MTELSFLIDLLMNHRLPKPTKELIAERIKEVEKAMTAMPQAPQRPTGAYQAPSTLAALTRQGVEPPPPVPVEAIAQTPAAAAAMASRQAAISGALAAMGGNIPKGQDRPRKF